MYHSALVEPLSERWNWAPKCAGSWAPYQNARSWAPISTWGVEAPICALGVEPLTRTLGKAPISMLWLQLPWALGVQLQAVRYGFCSYKWAGSWPSVRPEVSTFSALEVEPYISALRVKLPLCGRSYLVILGVQLQSCNQTTTTNNNLSMLFTFNC